MSTDVTITLRANDRFSAAFGQLQAVLARTDASGAATGASLARMGDSLHRLALRSGEAETALADFADGSAERLEGLSEQQRERLETTARLREESAQALAERLLAVDEAYLARKEALHAESQARLTRLQADHLNDWLERQQAFAERIDLARTASLNGQIELYMEFSTRLRALAEDHGKTLFRVVKTLGVAEALVGAYVAANNALSSAPFPFNLALSALVLAQGLANVERIRQTNVAHGGLERVPEDATFLLKQGERVLSPEQNRELTAFLAERPGGNAQAGVRIDTLNIHILENATSADALLEMEPAELRRIVSDRIIPALDELASLGIRPHFVASNL